ncbi:hypothetical protein [Actinoplanes sp. G11-F43]|uniref:hypothetical protein n=1 Tax=Actinoplanes sp. G11-F43 TaxID=3424130 RepID=UPI003D3335D1
MRGLARNPALPAEALRRLATTGPLDRWELTARAVWDDEAFDVLAGHPDPEVREALAQSPGATGAQRARLIGDLSIRVLHAVLEGPPSRWADPLPDWAYHRLAGHPEPVVRDMLTFLPGVPGDVVARLARDPQPGIAAAAQALLDRESAKPDTPDREHVTHAETGQRHAGRDRLGPDHVVRAGPARERAVEMASGAAPWDRAIAAADPELPDAWVTALAADPSPQVRLAVSMRPGLTEEQRAAIDHPTPAETPILDWVLAAGPTELRECAGSRHPALRRSAACHPDLPADLVAALAEDDDITVRLRLCEHRTDLPGELLVQVHLAVPDSDLPRHPAFPGTGLARHASSTDPRARALARLDPDAPEALIERLSHDPDMSVRASVADDHRLPVPRLLQLFDDPDTTGAASANPRLPVHLMDRILADGGITD